MGLTALGILDMTGIPLIVEGIVGQRAWGPKMDGFERAERIGSGLFALVAMVASVVKGVRGMRGRGKAPSVSEGKVRGLQEGGSNATAEETTGIESLAEHETPGDKHVPSTTGEGKSSVATTKQHGKSLRYKQSKAERKAAINKRQARYKRYDPSKRTDAELETDSDPAQRIGETKSEATARVKLALDEIEVRRILNIYNGLGDNPPPFDIIQNDMMNPAAHTVGTGTNGRHTPGIPLERQLDASGMPNGVRTLEGRMYGDPPWGSKMKTPTKWIDIATINREIRKYLHANWIEVRYDLALDSEHEALFDAGHLVGEGYVNIGTNSAPISSGPFPVSHVKIIFRMTPGSTSTFFVITSYPSMFGN